MSKTVLIFAVLTLASAYLYSQYLRVFELGIKVFDEDSDFATQLLQKIVDHQKQKTTKTGKNDKSSHKGFEDKSGTKYRTTQKPHESESINDKINKIDQKQPPPEAPIHLVTIDMSKFESDFEELSLAMGRAMHDVGFAYLTNVPGFDPDALFKSTKWFFDQDLERKLEIAKRPIDGKANRKNPNHYRGYFPLIQGWTSYKEMFEMGEFFDNPLTGRRPNRTGERLKSRDLLSEGNVWPKYRCSHQDDLASSENDDSQLNSEQKTDAAAECLKQKNDAIRFREIMERHFWVYSNASRNALSLIAHHLGFRKDHFHHMFHPGQLSTFRLLHYPDRRDDDSVPPDAFVEHGDASVLVTTAEHADTSILTLLATFHYPGLQLDLRHDGHWQDVPPLPNGLVMNLGRLLVQLVGEENVKATFHRVLDIGRSRYSVPFFYEPTYDTVVSTRLDGSPVPGAPPGTKYGQWMTTYSNRYAEYNSTDFGELD